MTSGPGEGDAPSKGVSGSDKVVSAVPRRRLLIAVMVTVVAVVLCAVATGFLLQERPSLTVLPPPDGPWPETLFSVWLCPDKKGEGEGAEKCRSGVTDRQRRAVETVIRGVPGVEKFMFVSAGEAARQTAEQFGEEGLLTEEEAPPSFDGHLRNVGDEDATRPLMDGLRAAVEDLPGVVSVNFSTEHLFWDGKSDLSVQLCGEGLEQEPPCTGRGRPTGQEREAIEAVLATVGGIDKVYFQEAEHTRKVAEYMLGEPPALHEVVESYEIKITDRRAVDAVKSVLRNVSGVGKVVVR
ncbi:permease-like cell division protein FtsX [Streptosporangium sp. CA-135522]|uniref:permease-like cell division protein FtsX n=1 Tax=Streptosporangium sp. CA-135522 TaxID=3240072 RepID=UPI003D8DA6EA